MIDVKLIQDQGLDDFIIWLKNNNIRLHGRIPRFHRVIYLEHCATGIGVQISSDVFKEYIDRFRGDDGKFIDGFSYRYDPNNDCTTYYIEDIPILRKYEWGCYS